MLLELLHLVPVETIEPERTERLLLSSLKDTTCYNTVVVLASAFFYIPVYSFKSCAFIP